MRWVLIAAGAVVFFVGGCTLSMRPAWQWLEKRSTEDLGTETPAHFPVLVRTDNGEGSYAVESYGNTGPETSIVTVVSEVDVDRINQDIANRADSDYFRIVDHGGDYLDVSLRVPTTGESRCVGWYRIQNGRIQPQRILAYGPGFAFEVLRVNLVIGAACSLVFVSACVLWRYAQTGKG